MKKNILILLVGFIAGTTLTATAAYVYTARDINYQPSDENWSVNNVQEALTELKTDVNNINNKVEGIKRVYKTGEVELVALVSDDSFYKDSNGKYVLSNSDTGRALLADTSTYKSLASTEDCIGEVGVDTASPFKGGGSKVYYLGTGASFDIKNLFPNDYQNFTVDNFIIKPTTTIATSLGTYNDNYSVALHFNMNASYTYSNGVLTILPYMKTAWRDSPWKNHHESFDPNSSGNIAISAKVYLVMGNIETI